MRQIEYDITAAIMLGYGKSVGNTTVTNSPLPQDPGVSWRLAPGAFHEDRKHRAINVYLHGNLIAEIHQWETVSGESFHTVRFDDCGWKTPTTKSRINAIAEVLGVPGVSQVKGEWFFHRPLWTGDAEEQTQRSRRPSGPVFSNRVFIANVPDQRMLTMLNEVDPGLWLRRNSTLSSTLREGRALMAFEACVQEAAA
tara:strand:+ start:66 stop:656 length:591 start_codon:yes stop_codon:yes gene_type:complete